MRTGSGTLNFLLGDHSHTCARDRLGSNAITTNSSGVKSAEIRYYPWGGERFYEYTSSTNYRFTGQRKEFGSGLYFYGARWSRGRAPGIGEPAEIAEPIYFLTCEAASFVTGADWRMNCGWVAK